MSRSLVMSLLGIFILTLISINLLRREEANFLEQIYRAQTLEAAAQEASFARSVSAYITSNSVRNGTVLTPAEMITAGHLAPGFPATNPFGQTPEAIVGQNNAALITFTTIPSTTIMAGFNQSTTSSIDLQANAQGLAADITAMQAGSPQLVGGILSAGELLTPMGGANITASTDFPGVTLPVGPVFADMLNILPVPTLNSNSGYGAVTGD